MFVIGKILEYSLHMSDQTKHSLDVLQEIVAENIDIVSVKLILHEVALNWGQKYDESSKIVTHFEESLIQEVPLELRQLDRQDFLNLTLDDLLTTNHKVWSFTSKVIMRDGTNRHIPMMNFHPLTGVNVQNIIDFIRLSEPEKEGVLLESGRYYHYYGYELLSENEWLQFNARFLMPMILVRARYIGHRLRDGYSTLRLTNDSTFKPKVPTVISRI